VEPLEHHYPSPQSLARRRSRELSGLGRRLSAEVFARRPHPADPPGTTNSAPPGREEPPEGGTRTRTDGDLEEIQSGTRGRLPKESAEAIGSDPRSSPLISRYRRAVTKTHSPGTVIPSAFVQVSRFERVARSTSRWTLGVSSERE